MSLTTKELEKYIEEVGVKYPELSKSIVLDILNNIPNKINMDDYKSAFLIEKQLGLSSSYFSMAYRRDTDIKAHIVKQNNFIYVRLDTEIKKLLEDKYICCKITREESDSFEHTISLTKNTLLGFYK